MHGVKIISELDLEVSRSEFCLSGLTGCQTSWRRASQKSPPAQARAWLEWYSEKICPKLAPLSTDDRIFTSAKTHLGLERSSVGMRFTAVVQQSMMHRRIGSYSVWAEDRPSYQK